jgi:quinoprotein glucose dehydrogenase
MTMAWEVRFMRTPVALMLGGALLALSASAPAGAETLRPGDWPRYTRDMAGTRFSPLAQINAANVAQLQPAWSFRVRPEGGGAAVSSATPIVLDNVMYLPIGNAVVALQADTGQELWRHPEPSGAARRAVSYWPGDAAHAPRIFYSSGKAIIALDAKTGQAVASFGANGEVALDVPYGSPPTIYKNVLVIGANVAEMPIGPPGDTRAFDAVTGKPLWVFHTVPRPGEKGHETWLDEGWKGRSGTNVWVWYMTLDDATGTLFMSVGGPSPNYYGGDRPGSNLFGNSVVAVDAQTGKLKWWFQTIHHDLWDSDLPAPPTLVDIHKDGRTIQALAETGKTAFMYILDRNTGKPVFGVKETPVAKADVPGEWYSPTQPIPVKPVALSRKSWDLSDVVTPADTNEAHVAACHKFLQDYGGSFFNSGPFTPFFLHEDGGPLKASINLPLNGGSLWAGTAADPRDGWLYINTSESGSVGYMEKRKAHTNYGRGDEDSPQLYDRANLAAPGAYQSFSASYTDPATGKTVSLPCIRPPWGRLIAVNANTGDIAWAVPLGVTDDLPPSKQNTGRNNTFGGPIVTAGGLVFIGASDDHRFRAFDARTGKQLWEYRLQYSAEDLPITYAGKDGRQYVAVVAAAPGGPRGANNESLIAFALPR